MVRGQGPNWSQRSKFSLRSEFSLNFLYSTSPPASCPQQPWQWTSGHPEEGLSPLNPGKPQKTLTHCGRCPQVPSCLKTPSCHCGSCPGSSSVPGAGTSGPEGARRGHPGVVGYPESCPPERENCGCAGRQLEGEFHSQD